MTVDELRSLLEGIDGDTEVVLSSDSEGNNYSPLAGHWVGVYEAENTWSGQMFDPDDEDDMEYCSENTVPAVVLTPTN